MGFGFERKDLLSEAEEYFMQALSALALLLRSNKVRNIITFLKALLTYTSIPELLNSFDLPSFSVQIQGKDIYLGCN